VQRGCLLHVAAHYKATFDVILPRTNIRINADENTDRIDRIAAWALSNPSELYRSLAEEYRKFLLLQCSNISSIIDFAVNLRTQRDVRGDISFNECYIDCLSNEVLEILHQHPNYLLQKSVCVFITSDDDILADNIAKRLKRNNSFVMTATGVQYRKGNLDSSNWHLGGLIQNTRYSLNISDIAYHTELLDWYILSEVPQAILTPSTFSSTARSRNSIIRSQRNFSDYQFGEIQTVCTACKWTKV
jgi:hypothetical protein